MHTAQTSVISLEESRELHYSHMKLVRPELDIHPFEFAAVEIPIQSQLFRDILLPTPVIWLEGMSLTTALTILSQEPTFKRLRGPDCISRSQHFCLESEDAGSLFIPTTFRHFHLLAYGQRTIRLVAICESKVIVADHSLSGKNLNNYMSSGLETQGIEVPVFEGLPRKLPNQSIGEYSNSHNHYVQFEIPF